MDKDITLTRELIESVIFNLSKRDGYYFNQLDKKLSQENIVPPEDDEELKSILDSLPDNIIESLLFLI